jgi:outer membrane immunogenic protein
MRKITAIGCLLSVTMAPAANAQNVTSEFRGFRVEANAGGDRFDSQGEHNDKFGYGGTIGFDGVIDDRFVIGAEGSYWRANNSTENCSIGINGGSICQKSFEEYGAAVRAGYLVTPKLLLFGKGGYVTNDQRKRFDPSGNLFYVDGQIVGPETGYYNHGGTDGYQVGGGAEFSLTDMFYVDGQYVYSNYHDHTARQRFMFGVGARFK